MKLHIHLEAQIMVAIILIYQIILPNDNLISSNFDLIDEPKRHDHYLFSNSTKYYYDTVVKEDWKINEDYTVISEKLFSYFSHFFTWKRPIVR